MDYRRLFLTLIFTISAFLLWDGWSQQKAAQKAATIQAAAQTAPAASVDLRIDGNNVPARAGNAPAADAP